MPSCFITVPGGDADTVGAIAGALAGAQAGCAWVPHRWWSALQSKASWLRGLLRILRPAGLAWELA